jgi:hypothetical protein
MKSSDSLRKPLSRMSLAVLTLAVTVLWSP